MVKKRARSTTTRVKSDGTRHRPRDLTRDAARDRPIEHRRKAPRAVPRGRQADPPRWNPDPEDVQRSVVKLVLSLVEFIRQLMERQSLRRLDAGTLDAEEIEALGVALMRLEETVRQIAERFNLDPSDLNLDLGPLGKLT